jgi:hypothetical protein
MATIPQNAVIAAWANMKADFAKEAVGGRLPDHRTSVGDVGLCRLGSSRGTGWMTDETTLELFEMKITRFEGVASQAATFSDKTTAHLPIGFSTLEVKGKYRLRSVCKLIGMFGMEMSKQDQSATGTLTETFTSTLLVYTATVGANLSITGAEIPDKRSVDGKEIVNKPSVDVTCDSELPGWLQQFAAVMSGQDLQEKIRGGLVNLFQTAGFAKTMIANLNKKLGV